MKSIADVETEVRVAIFADRDRSVERTIELAVRAGIAHERERFREILSQKVQPARGIETAVVTMALAGKSVEEVRSLIAFMTSNIGAEDVARHRREEFRVIENVRNEEVHHVGQNG